MAIYETIINDINSEVVTVCSGLAGGAAAIILAAGAKDKRMALTNSKIVLCETTLKVEQLLHRKELTPEENEL